MRAKSAWEFYIYSLADCLALVCLLISLLYCLNPILICLEAEQENGNLSALQFQRLTIWSYNLYFLSARHAYTYRSAKLVWSDASHAAFRRFHGQACSQLARRFSVEFFALLLAGRNMQAVSSQNWTCNSCADYTWYISWDFATLRRNYGDRGYLGYSHRSRRCFLRRNHFEKG